MSAHSRNVYAASNLQQPAIQKQCPSQICSCRIRSDSFIEIVHKVTTFQTLNIVDAWSCTCKGLYSIYEKLWIYYVSTSPKGKPASCRGSCYLMNIWLWPFLLFDGLLVFETVLFCILRSMQSNPPVKLESHCTKFMLQIYGDKYNSYK